MRVLLVHNFYRSTAPSGENQVFEVERELLRSRGHEVDEFVRHSDELNDGLWGLLKGGASTAWNPWMAEAIKLKVQQFKPDVVHVHNTFPLISPAIFRTIGTSAAKVLTLHNYRLFCAAAIPMRRNGNICVECLDQRSSLPALIHRCYRGSAGATVPLAASISLHRGLGTWTRHVDGFVALTEFQRQMMTQAGLPQDRVHVKPNFFPGDPVPVKWSDRRDVAVFAGRLSAEKGAADLVKAWAIWGRNAPELRILGDGPLRADLESRAQGARITFLGQVTPAQAQEQIANAKLMVLPSLWFECFPMTIREAFAFATPVATTDVGPLPTIVKHGQSGIIFKGGSPESLLTQVQAAWQDSVFLERLSRGSRHAYEQSYTEEINYRELMAIYESSCSTNRARSHASSH